MTCRQGRRPTTARQAVAGAKGARILIVQSPYYLEVSQALIAGAEREIARNGAASECVAVPGAFEIPAADRHGGRAL